MEHKGRKQKQHIAFVVPAYNEELGIEPFYSQLIQNIPDKYSFSILFVDDGSKDETLKKLKKLKNKDQRVEFLSFSRNFGKESATTAGINYAKGDAIIILDADGQHPVELIPKMLDVWESGAQTVIGVRKQYGNEGLIKTYGSRFFYSVFNKISSTKLVPGSTDFRLIDKQVQAAFNDLREHGRMTRALLDWVGFKSEYIYFESKDRQYGTVSYSTGKLLGLALNSFVSLSSFPIYLPLYLGLIITPLSFILGTFVLIEQYILNDPLNLNFTGSASLGVFITFLVGIVLLSQGLIALYLSRIYEEGKDRPLYIIDSTNSSIKTRI